MTEAELRAYCERYAAELYVRDALPSGGYGAISWAELPPERQEIHIQRWIERGTFPERQIGMFGSGEGRTL